MNNKSRNVVYFEEGSRRIIKISEFTPITNPANIDGASWHIYAPGVLPEDILIDMNQYQVGIDKRLKKTDILPTDEETASFKKLSDIIDCLEILARHISVSRFAKITNMTGYFFLIPEYQKEIENYRLSGEVGPLLASMVDNNDDLPSAISEFEIKNQTAMNFYILTETLWNNWSRRIKNSDEPYLVLDAFRSSIGFSK